MRKWKQALCVLLSAALIGTMAGCGSSTSYAMTIDGVEIRAGMYIYYLYVAYSEAISTLSEEDSELDTSDDDAIRDLTLEDETVEEWIQDEALIYCQEYAAVQNQCEELGLELSEDEIEEIEDSIESVWDSYGETYEDNGISQGSIELILENTYLEEDLFFYYYEVDGAEGVTEDDLQEYYIENNARVRYIAFELTDGNGDELDDDGKEEMLEMIGEYLEDLEDCDGDADELNEEMDEIEEEYDEYVTSISEEAAEETATTETDEDGNVVTTTTTTTTEETTEETTTTEEEDEDETETTSTVDDEDEEEETTADEDEDDEDEDETTTTTTDEEESDEEDEDSEDEDSEDEDEDDEDEDEDETTTTTTEEPYPNESIIERVTTDEDTDEDDLTYSPSETVYDYIFGDEIEIGVPAIVEDEDNNMVYLLVRLDIEDRMNEDDLWTDDTIESVIWDMFWDEFSDTLDTWCDEQDVALNDDAIKRYDAFDIDMSY